MVSIVSTIFLKRLLLIAMGTIPLVYANNTNNIPPVNSVNPSRLNQINKKLAKLETAFGGRIGVYAVNTANNESIQYRADVRFPMCSTSKVMVVGAILNKSINSPNFLNTNIKYNQKDLDNSGYHPITEKHLATGMTILELCEAVLEYSDNTAMNILIRQLGGIDTVNAYARTIGDKMFRLDRYEPELNTAIPGDIRDTSTPLAMEKSLQNLMLGKSLQDPQRIQLQTWLKNNTTGNATIRAGVPDGWIVGDKTGSGGYGTRNDIGVIWPSKCSAIIMAIYTTQNKKDAIPRDGVIASVTRELIDEFAHSDSCLVVKK